MGDIYKAAMPVVMLLSITACGGSGGGSGGDGEENIAPSAQTGVFLDSAVGGINYRTETLSGVTNQQGEFSYVEGEIVTFSIGSIDLPSTRAKNIITPLDLVGTNNLEDVAVTNISRLLQSLDEDNNTSNGITINEISHYSASGMSIDFTSGSFDNDVTNLVANSGSSNTVLIDASTAREHLNDTITKIVSVDAWNNLQGTWNHCENTPGSSVSLKIRLFYSINDGYNEIEYPYREREAIVGGYGNTTCQGEPVTSYGSEGYELGNKIFNIELSSSTDFQLNYSEFYSDFSVIIGDGGDSMLIGNGSFLYPITRYTRE